MKKVGKFIKNNIVGFILGALLFGGSALVVAGTVASSAITYTTSKNSNVGNVEQALNDLYNIADNTYYKYWNDDYLGAEYISSSSPNRLYSQPDGFKYISSDGRTVYTLNNVNEAIPYIKSLYKNDNTIKHEGVCYYLNNYSPFCINYGFWQSVVGSNTASLENSNAVKAALETAIHGVFSDKNINCDDSTSNYVNCFIGNDEYYNDCYVYANGEVKFITEDGNLYCNIKTDGKAKCEADDAYFN